MVMWPCAEKISLSIQSVSDRGLPSSVSAASGGEGRQERVPVPAVDGGNELAHGGVGGFFGTHGSSLVFRAKGQRSPMPTCRMMPAPMKLSAAVVIQSSGLALLQCAPL